MAALPLLAQAPPRAAGRAEIGRALVQFCTAAAGANAAVVNSFIAPSFRGPNTLAGVARECSVPGATRVAAQGQFGPAVTLFPPDRVASWATRAGLNPATCVAFRLPPAEVVACRHTDGTFLFVRVDDVARLR